MNFLPYTGITGFTNRSEVLAALAAFPQTDKRKLMVGVLASNKTLHGASPQYYARYPHVNAINQIFVNDQRAINLVHYTTNDPNTLHEQLKQIVDTAGSLLHGFQLNIHLPDPQAFAWLTENYKRIVLQLNSRLLATMEQKGIQILNPYCGIVTDVLIDNSGGRGLLIPMERAAKFVDKISEAFPQFGIGIAGGFCAETVDMLLLRKNRRLSVDAEGRLRDENDNLDLDKVRAYLKSAEYLAL